MFRLFRIWRSGGRELRLLWFALRHAHRPAWLLPAALVIAAVALDPFNFAVPFFGVVDDLILVPLLLHALAKLLPMEIRWDFARRSVRRDSGSRFA